MALAPKRISEFPAFAGVAGGAEAFPMAVGGLTSYMTLDQIAESGSISAAITAALAEIDAIGHEDMGEVVPASPYTQATVQAALDTVVANCLANSGPRRLAFYEHFISSGGVRAGNSVTNAPANMRIKNLEIFFAPGVRTQKTAADFNSGSWNDLFEFIYCEGLTVRGGTHYGRVSDTWYEDIMLPADDANRQSVLFVSTTPNGASTGGVPLTGHLFGDDGFRFFSCDDLLLIDMHFRNYGDSAWRITPIANDVEEAAGQFGAKRTRVIRCTVINSFQTSTTNTSGTGISCPLDYWMHDVYSERINSNKWAHRGIGKKSKGLYATINTTQTTITGMEIDGYSQAFVIGGNIRAARNYGISYLSNDTVLGGASLGPDVLKVTDTHIEATPTMLTGFRIQPDGQGSGNSCPTVMLQNCSIEGVPGWVGTAVGATTDATGYAAGATVIGLASAGTGAIVAGNYVKFANDAYTYLVTSGDADVSNGGSITISPGLKIAISAAVTRAISFPGGGIAAYFDGKFSDLYGDIHLKDWVGTNGLQVAARESQNMHFKVSGNYPRNDGVGHVAIVERKVPIGVFTSADQLEDVTIELAGVRTSSISRFMLVDGIRRLTLKGRAYGSPAGMLYTNTTYGCEDVFISGADFRSTGGAGLIFNNVIRGFITDSIIGAATSAPISIATTCGGMEITDSVKIMNGNAWAIGGDGRGVTDSQGFVLSAATRTGVNVDALVNHVLGTDLTVPASATPGFAFIRPDNTEVPIVSVARQGAGTIRAVLSYDIGTAGTAAGATTDATGYAIGTTTVTLASAGTGTIVAGNFVKFGTDPNPYLVVTGDADVSNGGTVVVAAPGLRVAIPASATAITFAANRFVHFPRGRYSMLNGTTFSNVAHRPFDNSAALALLRPGSVSVF